MSSWISDRSEGVSPCPVAAVKGVATSSRRQHIRLPIFPQEPVKNPNTLLTKEKGGKVARREEEGSGVEEGREGCWVGGREEINVRKGEERDGGKGQERGWETTPYISI